MCACLSNRGSSEFDSVVSASQLLLAVCERNTTIGTSCQGSMLPSITNVINLADSHDRAAFAMATHIKQEPRERENSETKEEVSCAILCIQTSVQKSLFAPLMPNLALVSNSGIWRNF